MSSPTKTGSILPLVVIITLCLGFIGGLVWWNVAKDGDPSATQLLLDQN